MGIKDFFKTKKKALAEKLQEAKKELFELPEPKVDHKSKKHEARKTHGTTHHTKTKQEGEQAQKVHERTYSVQVIGKPKVEEKREEKIEELEEIKEDLEEEVKHKLKAEEVLTLQAEAKRQEILGKLSDAVGKWKTTGQTGLAIEQPKSLKERLKEKAQVVARLKDQARVLMQQWKDSRNAREKEEIKEELEQIESQLTNKPKVEDEIDKIYKEIENA
jgi:hypothetical protein